MTTQIFEREDAAGLRLRAVAAQRAREESSAVARSAFRGLFYAVLFNAFILLTAFGAWELWRRLR